MALLPVEFFQLTQSNKKAVTAAKYFNIPASDFSNAAWSFRANRGSGSLFKAYS
jgi:hypothetical protein